MSRQNGATLTPPAEVKEQNPLANMPPEMLAGLVASMQSAKGGELIRDEDVLFHPTPDIKSYVLPQNTTYEQAISTFQRKRDEANEVHAFSRKFLYRPNDGAYATGQVMKALFGITVGKATPLPFGMSRPPGLLSIDIGYKKKAEVPWGEVEIPALKGAVAQLGMTRDKNFGVVFELSVESPKKHRKEIEKFFDAVDAYLAEHSIYRGKALLGAEDLTFMNLATFDPRQIVFSDEVNVQLDGAVMGLLRHQGSYKEANISPKRAVLLYGPFGTGKSSFGLMAAIEAVQNGWTFLSATAGRESLRDVFQTARLYGPSVVFVEDIDVHTPQANNKAAISELLDVFDGIGGKGEPLLVIMTTNHIEDVPAGMLRPGRLDFAVEINGLDRTGTENLIRAVTPPGLLGDIDFDEVYAEMEGFQPAWVRATADRAKSFAIAREGGDLAKFVLTTWDLVAAARSLHPQLKLMNAATEGAPVEPFAEAFASQMRTSMHGMRTLDYDGDFTGTLALPVGVDG